MNVNIDHSAKMTGDNLYKRLVKWWLISILVFLPFQINIANFIAHTSSKLSGIINKLDELTIVIFLLLAILEHCKNRKALDISFFFY
jgi:hypothetical protein